MDTGTHLRAVWVRRWWVLAVAALAGLLVLVVRSAVPTTWQAEVRLFVTAPADDERSVERLSAAYLSFADDPRVVAEARARAGLPAGSALEDAEVVLADDGVLAVLATAGTAESAVALADALAASLSSAAGRDQLQQRIRDVEPLDAELAAVTSRLAALPPAAPQRELLRARQDRLDAVRVEVLARPRAHLDVVQRTTVEDALAQPSPVREAALAAVVALVLAAQAAVLLGSRRQGLEAVDPVAALEEWSGLPVFRWRPDHGPDETAAAVARARSSAPAGAPPVLYVARLSGPEPAAVAALQAAATDLLGPSALLTAAPPPGPGGSERSVPGLGALVERLRRERPAVVDAGPWTSAALLRLAHDVPGPCLLLVDRARARRPQLQEALRALGHAGTAPVALVLVEGRRPVALPAARPAEDVRPSRAPVAGRA